MENCIESVLSQTFRDFKMIICDLNSTDGSYQLLQEKYKDNPYLKIYQQDFSCKSDAYNFCIANATGMYVMCVNPFEILSDKCLEIMFNELDDDPDFSLISGGEDNYNPSKDSTESSSEINRIDSLNRLSFINQSCLGSGIDRIGGFNNYQSDSVLEFDFYFRLSEIGKGKQCFQQFVTVMNNDKTSTNIDKSNNLQFTHLLNDILQRQGLSRFKLESKV